MTDFMWGRPEGYCDETGINYRDLLKKYMDYVGSEEGTTFIGPWLGGGRRFSEEEAAELMKIDGELDGTN